MTVVFLNCGPNQNGNPSGHFGASGDLNSSIKKSFSSSSLTFVRMRYLATMTVPSLDPGFSCTIYLPTSARTSPIDAASLFPNLSFFHPGIRKSLHNNDQMFHHTLVLHVRITDQGIGQALLPLSESLAINAITALAAFLAESSAHETSISFATLSCLHLFPTRFKYLRLIDVHLHVPRALGRLTPGRSTRHSKGGVRCCPRTSESHRDNRRRL